MTVAVLVMAHGTPATREEIAAFYTRIRRGRPPSPEQLAELVGRYEAIGGLSPLNERTRAQVEGLAAQLERSAPGRYRVAFGAKHAAPLLEEAARDLAALTPSGVVGLVLTPQRAARGSSEYLERAAAALHDVAPGTAFVPVEHWFDAPGLAELWAQRVARSLAGAGPGQAVVFSAHAVPETEGGDALAYLHEVERTAQLVASAAGLGDRGIPWRVAFQSAGRTEQRWLGPDLLSTIDALAAGGHRGVVVCPVGFVADHLEILYDLDVEARARAERAGIAFARTESLNDDPRFLATLAGVVDRAAAGGG
jgi:protoporphyrin/coproporphyrin ferrochelatase